LSIFETIHALLFFTPNLPRRGAAGPPEAVTRDIENGARPLPSG
jgi:hypothetical protein